MDGEQLDGSTVRAVERVRLRLDWIGVSQLEQLAGKAGATSFCRAVPTPSQLEELLHVGERLLAKGRAGDRHRVLGLLEQDAKQGADPQAVALSPKLGVEGDKPLAAAPLVVRQLRREQRAGLPQAPERELSARGGGELDQRGVANANQRRAQNGGEGERVAWIGN